jgi:hypothetical protein
MMGFRLLVRKTAGKVRIYLLSGAVQRVKKSKRHRRRKPRLAVHVERLGMQPRRAFYDQRETMGPSAPRLVSRFENPFRVRFIAELAAARIEIAVLL